MAHVPDRRDRDIPVDELPEPVSQAKDDALNTRLKRPAFLHDFPRTNMETKPDFSLIDPGRLDEILADAPDTVRNEIMNDVAFLESEVLKKFFIQRDAEASQYQNRYRWYQVIYIMLAFTAMILGSIQAWSLERSMALLAVIAFMETMIALAATFVATISSSEPPLSRWITNRRIAEYLRQEYFRFLLRVDPYDKFTTKSRRELHLARRAAEINSGKTPEVKVEGEDNESAADG